MNRINIQYYKTKVGEFILGSFDRRLCMLDWRYRRMRSSIDKRITNTFEAEYVEKADRIIDGTIAQLDDYLNGKRNEFDIPLFMVGTDFQKTVWKALRKVPYGATSTYSKLADTIGNKKAVRAVASANGANAISLIIPCHRILGRNGELVGYAGGLSVKQRLLNLEQDNNSMKQCQLHMH